MRKLCFTVGCAAAGCASVLATHLGCATHADSPVGDFPAFKHRADNLSGPLVEPWRTLRPAPDHHGQWLVAGDLDGDGIAEIITARNDRQHVTAAVAMRLDGEALWTWGTPGAGKPELNYDVPLQIHDIDRDGRAEVYLSADASVIILDGATGREQARHALPDGLEVADCITFADLRGTGYPRDIIIKNRYHRLWAYTPDWRLLWSWTPREGMVCHHPTPVDLDGDGRDEVMAGFVMLNADGTPRWSLDVDHTRGHLDCCEIMRAGNTPADVRLLLTCCGGNRLVMTDGTGRIIWELAGRHFESVDAGELDADRPGREIVVDVDHEPYGEGPVWVLDEQGRRIGAYICGYGRHHRLIDWNGDGVDELLIGNARRLFDARGHCLARFGPTGAFDAETGPQRDGDPQPFAATGDLDGDDRPEIILHSSSWIRIYRSDRAKKTPGSTPGTGLNATLY